MPCNPTSRIRNPKRDGISMVIGLAATLACTAIAPAAEFTAHGKQGMVASDSAYASRVGCEVLKSGGNAVDAAVATSLALAVTRPFSTGLGGGGFMMVRLANGDVFVLDARETAPAAAKPDMFVSARAASPDAPRASQYGGLAAGVPGLLAGHQAVLERLGTRTLRELVEPARLLAANGFTVDESYLDAASGVARDIAGQPGLRTMTAALQRQFLIGDAKLAPGVTLKQPELASTLAAIGRDGAAAFYRGPIGEAIVRTVHSTGGIITAADLAGYQPVWRKPLRVRYRERYELLLMPPSSSGGVAMAETLNILEGWDLAGIRSRDPGLAAHLTVEALKHAFADRARHLGDADFVRVPLERLTGKAYAADLARRIREDRAGEPDKCGTIPDDAGTSHYCVADRWGNVVSATETVNTSWGCLVVVEPWGFVLNNEMDDFSAEPGRANAYNLQHSEANAVAAGKRPLSCMSPTIVLDGGKPVLAVGASGGPRIITGTLQVIMNVVDYHMSLGDAVAQPRFHHQWQPNEVSRNDYAADSDVVRGLEKRGHTVSGKNRGAVVQALLIGPDGFIGASDPRKGGQPAGY